MKISQWKKITTVLRCKSDFFTIKTLLDFMKVFFMETEVSF